MTDKTLADRLARCVKPLVEAAAHLLSEIDAPQGLAEIVEATGPLRAALAALDMDALAQEVEAMVGAEREACARVAFRLCAETRHVTLGKSVEDAIRAREGGNP
jgi:hypothetical protein